jgi:hypothetical protein
LCTQPFWLSVLSRSRDGAWQTFGSGSHHGPAGRDGPPQGGSADLCLSHILDLFFPKKKQVRIGHSRPSKMTCLYVHKTGANRPFSTFKNGHVFRSQGPSLTKMVIQIVTRVVNYTQNVKFHTFLVKQARYDVRACIHISSSVPLPQIGTSTVRKSCKNTKKTDC